MMKKFKKYPTKITQKTKTKQFTLKISPRDISVFARQLATLLGAGVPLVQSIEIIARGQDNKGIGYLMDTIKGEIESGLTLAESLANHPQYFDRLFCQLVKVGEQAGALEILLRKIADYQERSLTLKTKLKKALFYRRNPKH